MIELRDLKKAFGQPPTEVLKGVSARIEPGEMVSIVGRSGSGKSSLLYIVSTLDRPTSGQVIIDGVDVQTLSVKELHQFRNERMGFVFQFHHLLPELTALENVLMPALKTGRDKNLRGRALDLLGEFGLRQKWDRRPGQMSGGEQQRVAIARALVMEPRYLFADEPTGNLDSKNGEAVLNFFRKIHVERGTTIVYVTHDPLFAKLADRELVLVDGLIQNEPGLSPFPSFPTNQPAPRPAPTVH
jgi:putative ABC transport system ATP-binding protein/lipoprotein-releasing system ATP-binding protein